MKTVIFDFDGTLHQGYNIWKALWHSLGYETHRFSKYYEMLQDYKNGTLSKKDWYEITRKAFERKGLSQKKVWAIADKIQLLEGAEETFKTLKENGYALYIVSGNVDDVIKIALKNSKKYFDGIYANKFIYNKNGFFKAINGTNYDYEGKAKFIERYKRETGTPAKDITFVGDGENDEWAYLSGCKTICLNPYEGTDSTNTTKWHKVIKTKNLTDLLPEILEENEHGLK